MNGFQADSVVAIGARAARRAVPGPQKRYATVFDLSKSRACRHLSGEDRNTPFVNTLNSLMESEYANAFVLLAEGWAVVKQGQVRTQSTEWLWARLSELDEVEHSVEARENADVLRSAHSPTPDSLRAAAEADVREAEVQLERAAIRRELAERMERNTA